MDQNLAQNPNADLIYTKEMKARVRLTQAW